jgi:hypothetical protein
MVVPTGLFQVITGIYRPNNFKGLDRRLDFIEAKFREIFAKPPGLARVFLSLESANPETPDGTQVPPSSLYPIHPNTIFLKCSEFVP